MYRLLALLKLLCPRVIGAESSLQVLHSLLRRITCREIWSALGVDGENNPAITQLRLEKELFAAFAKYYTSWPWTLMRLGTSKYSQIEVVAYLLISKIKRCQRCFTISLCQYWDLASIPYNKGIKVKQAVSFFGFMTVANKDPDLRVIGIEESCYLMQRLCFRFLQFHHFVCVNQSIVCINIYRS